MLQRSSQGCGEPTYHARRSRNAATAKITEAVNAPWNAANSFGDTSRHARASQTTASQSNRTARGKEAATGAATVRTTAARMELASVERLRIVRVIRALGRRCQRAAE